MGAEDRAERRSAMLAEAIRHTAHVAGEIDTHALHAHLITWAGVPEEECGGDIYATMFFMVRCGLYTTNTPDTLAAETRLKVSHLLMGHLYDEHPPEPDDDEA
ncbi:hypothetical protein Q8W71_17835 [Methylobacterium sp. NEAU 140]|uniref:hypothetical protein n=1 Tax=Methylobacterium sp. NEAU 140 TaxID=3064945 RepID=UPI002732ABF9|nr:hypothetical protein [Methylobacterium sp. NEAU 140]MDP4024488.1 hypothetical protein [Methylobacterium sp. NEAU 140]